MPESDDKTNNENGTADSDGDNDEDDNDSDESDDGKLFNAFFSPVMLAPLNEFIKHNPSDCML